VSITNMAKPVHSLLRLTAAEDIPMSTLIYNCSECLRINRYETLSPNHEWTFVAVRFSSKIVSNVWFVKEFAILMTNFNSMQNLEEILKDVQSMLSYGVSLRTNTTTVHLNVEFMIDTWLEIDVYAHWLSTDERDIQDMSSLVINENLFCNQVDLMDTEMEWIPADHGDLVLNYMNKPFIQGNHIVIKDTSKVLHGNQYILSDYILGHVRVCHHHTAFTAFQHGNSSAEYLHTKKMFSLLLMSGVLLFINFVQAIHF